MAIKEGLSIEAGRINLRKTISEMVPYGVSECHYFLYIINLV